MQSVLKKVVTCHAGGRDSYQLSIAFQEQGLLQCLVTDLFLPPFLGKKIHKRYTSNLPHNKVENTFLNFFRQKLLKTSFTITDQILTNKALNLGLKNDSSFFLYSYTAHAAFEYLKRKKLNNKCFLFQLHPHPLSIKSLLTDELLSVPNARDSIMKEPEMYLNDEQLERLNGESILADQIIVASSYTKQTLIDNNVSPEKISIIPYGVDSNSFQHKLKYDEHNGYIKLVFVGQMIQRKGLIYLFEAIKILNSKNIELTLIGRGVIDIALINEYKKYFNINIKINISRKELVNELHLSDLLVFPSLVEGFGHVILEAMSIGLPVLCTSNTAGPDLFVNGDEGILVPIRSAEAIAEKIDYFINHKKELAHMGLSASKTAKIFTWEKFRHEIVDLYKSRV
jgi:glycosyltransferase involved in cell wall biosynthesis